MMIRFFLILIVLFAAVMIGLNLSHEPGSLTITTKTWHIETSLWIAAILALISLFVFHLLCLGLRFLIQTPHALSVFFKTHQQHHAQSLTYQGMIAFTEGDWLGAQKQFMRGALHQPFPLLNYIMAARAAQAREDFILRDTYLTKAEQIEPKALFTIKLLQAQLQIQAFQWEEALTTLTLLHQEKPKQVYVSQLLAQCYENCKNTPLETVRTFFQNAPKAVKNQPRFLAVFVQYLIQHQAWQEANTLIKQALRTSLNDTLIYLYAKLPIEEDKIAFINLLVKKYPKSASLQYCCGLLYFQSRLFGQAKLHFEASLAMQPTPASYFQLAQTLEALNLREEAYQIFRKGLGAMA